MFFLTPIFHLLLDPYFLRQSHSLRWPCSGNQGFENLNTKKQKEKQKIVQCGQRPVLDRPHWIKKKKRVLEASLFAPNTHFPKQNLLTFQTQ